MKRRNPYKIKHSEFNKFRGVLPSELGASMGPAYVAGALNTVSPIMGESRQALGGVPVETLPASGELNGAAHDAGGRIVAVGTSIYASAASYRDRVPLEDC